MLSIPEKCAEVISIEETLFKKNLTEKVCRGSFKTLQPTLFLTLHQISGL